MLNRFVTLMWFLFLPMAPVVAIAGLLWTPEHETWAWWQLWLFRSGFALVAAIVFAIAWRNLQLIMMGEEPTNDH